MMAPWRTMTPRLRKWETKLVGTVIYRLSSQYSHRLASAAIQSPVGKKSVANKKLVSAMSRLPIKSLVRSLILTSLMSSKMLLNPCVSIMGAISRSKSAYFDPDKNPILNRLLRWTVYNHFCAGTKQEEVRMSVADIKSLGFQGVILTHAKEILLEDYTEDNAQTGDGSYGPACYKVIEAWKQYSLTTLHMLQPGDILALKLTGAGPIAADALRNGWPMPYEVSVALNEICEETKKQGSRLWVDAEQQGLQHTVDDWSIELMRKWNRNGSVVIYNTIQAYLKASEANADRHITLAAKEGWSLGIKLVRGAYIEQETRSLIHDTKEDTDSNYDSIAAKFVQQELPIKVQKDGLAFPAAALMLATHNAASSSKACADHRARQKAGLPTCAMECAQIVGMADELSCELVQNYERCTAELEGSHDVAPKVFKCLTWGSIGECFGYLYRRAIENQSAVERTKHMAAALRRELWRRLTNTA